MLIRDKVILSDDGDNIVASLGQYIYFKLSSKARFRRDALDFAAESCEGVFLDVLLKSRKETEEFAFVGESKVKVPCRVVVDDVVSLFE